MLSKPTIKRNFNLIKDVYKNMYGKCHTLNIEHIFFKIKNEARVPSLSTSLLPFTANLSQCSETRKRNKVTKIGKEETKLSLFADGIIFLYGKLKRIYRWIIWMNECLENQQTIIPHKKLEYFYMATINNNIYNSNKNIKHFGSY